MFRCRTTQRVLAVQIQISDGKHFCLPSANMGFVKEPQSWITSFTSSLLTLPSQVGCTYVLLSSIRVNVFHFHVACNHCSSTCFLDHICDTVTVFNQTPRPVKAANWWSTSSPQGSLSFFILRYPNLEKTPNLNRFYKKKKWVYLIKKTKMIYLTIGQSQPGIFTFKNYEFQKKNTHFL